MKTKLVNYAPKGVNKDITSGVFPSEFLYDAKNIRFNTTKDSIAGSFAFEKGNEKVVTIPNIVIDTVNNEIQYNGEVLPYNNNEEIDIQINNNILPISSNSQVIIGHSVTRTSVVFFTTDNSGDESSHMDCIWEVNNETFEIKLLYLRNMGFSINFPIQAIHNFENENIQKVYWVDGVHQVRFLNTKHELIEGNAELINIPLTTLNFVGNVNFSQPYVDEIAPGGANLASMVQYAYNLYRLNSSQTKISPLSELVPIDRGGLGGGGEVNEVIGRSPIVKIDDIDLSYTHIKVYAIRYTSYNELPSIELIEERELDGDDSITLFDTGSNIGTLSLEEFLFLGSDPISPKHIETKDNNLFMFNIKDRSFDIPKELDCRAYSFPINSLSTTVYKDPIINTDPVTGIESWTGEPQTIDDTMWFNFNYKHPAINLNYDTHRYLRNSNTEGGEGPYLYYRLTRPLKTSLENDVNTYRFFKDREIYRIGIIFYNALGQKSLPRWIADFKAPTSNLRNRCNTLSVTLKPEFFNFINNYAWEEETDKPVGFKIIRANRFDTDRSIICQGIIGPMCVNIATSDDGIAYDTKKTYANSNTKLPNILLRTKETVTPLQPLEHLRTTSNDVSPEWNSEIQTDVSKKFATTLQYNVMGQLYSPEYIFGSTAASSATKLRIIGGVKNYDNRWWGRQMNRYGWSVDTEAKAYNGIHPRYSDVVPLIGNWHNLMDKGLINHAQGEDPVKFTELQHWYRGFNNFTAASNIRDWHIYGKPETTARGQTTSTYNNDPNFKYKNNLIGFKTDGDAGWDDQGSLDRAIVNVTSHGAPCGTFVTSRTADDIPTDDPHLRPTIEEMTTAAELPTDNMALIGEFVIPESEIYVGSLYGGNSYENKKRTSYIEIGEYKLFNSLSPSISIDNPGDTYVDEFKFARICPADWEGGEGEEGSTQIVELVSFPVETTVNLKNRSDISHSTWDDKFQPRYDEYHDYNRVYSQQPTLVQNIDLSFNFQKVKTFDTKIQASKVKIPNETVDSWTNILPNETMFVDGRYGPINGVVSFKDEIYIFQDNAFALIQINPRIQTQASDGISIELGKGEKLYDYIYASTTSGSLNKWGIISSPNAIYYLDGLNKKFNRFTDKLEFLSELNGMHSYLDNNIDISMIKADNPLIGKGVSIGYDQKTNDVYLTYNNTWTLGFNELLNTFTGNYSYNSPMYIYNRDKLLTVNPNNFSTVYETHAGMHNYFYDINQVSSIIILAAPEGNTECIFNNLEYKSEVPGNINYTWEYIRAFNEFQDSGVKELNKYNLRRLNRKHRLIIPRNANSRDRIRNNWVKIELSSKNENGYYYKNDNIILYYIPNYIIIQ